MQKLFASIFAIAILAALAFAPIAPRQNLTAQLLPESTTPEQLQIKYNNGTLKILLIPGHTDNVPGAMYRNLREVEINREMVKELATLFQYDSHITTYTLDDVQEYLQETEEIENFLNKAIATTKKLTSQGYIKRQTNGIQHVRIPYENALRLYGINKWANDNGVDLVLHVHFNDYPGHISWLPGDYNGFTIFIPEGQLPNHRASLAVAEAIKNQLSKFFPVSNNHLEDEGIIESQTLIAIGAKATLYGASNLIEYSYIYESQIVNEKMRAVFLRELAYQTYFAIKKYFSPEIEGSVLENLALPYTWRRDLHRGLRSDPDVFALQLALTQEGFYPPTGFNKNDCPPTGNFGPCTERAVIAFQKRHELPATGVADTQTLSKLSAALLPSFFTALK